jgi:hypothetical protein
MFIFLNFTRNLSLKKKGDKEKSIQTFFKKEREKFANRIFLEIVPLEKVMACLFCNAVGT